MTSFQSLAWVSWSLSWMVKVCFGPMSAPLGLSTVAMPICARTSSSCMPFSTSFAGSIWMRMAGVCWPPTRTSDTPEIWLRCWARMFSAASSTSMTGATSD